MEPPVFAPRALVEDAISKEPWQKILSVLVRRVDRVDLTCRRDMVLLAGVIMQLRDFASRIEDTEVEVLQVSLHLIYMLLFFGFILFSVKSSEFCTAEKISHPQSI